MKVGDLVRFKGHTASALGIVLYFKDLPLPPHPSQPDQSAAYIEWACEHTAHGHYQLCILEVVDESR